MASVVLRDQLNTDSCAFDGFDPAQDAVWMAEVEEESTHVWSSKQRIALFLTAMRHFALEVEALGWALHYTPLDAGSGFASLATVLQNTIENIATCALILCAPGDFRV